MYIAKQLNLKDGSNQTAITNINEAVVERGFEQKFVKTLRNYLIANTIPFN